MVQSSWRGVVSGTPGNLQEGDVWYDDTDGQYKGYDGTETVILG